MCHKNPLRRTYTMLIDNNVCGCQRRHKICRKGLHKTFVPRQPSIVKLLSPSTKLEDFRTCLTQDCLDIVRCVLSRCLLRRDAQDSCRPMYLSFGRSEEHTSELQSHVNLVCRL